MAPANSKLKAASVTSITRQQTPVKRQQTPKWTNMFRRRHDITVTDPNVSSYDIFKKLEKFGPIESLRKKKSNQFSILFSSISNTNDNCDISGTTAHSPNAIDHQPQPGDLPNLNYYCLMDIFELLSLQDLYAVAMVSEYFREIAVRVFRLRHRDRYFSHENVSFFVNCLRVFSPSQVQIPYRVDEVIAFEAIAEYCPNLTAISFTKECQEPQSNNIIAKLLPKLRKIEMPDICHCSDNWQVEDLHMAKGIKPLATYVTMPKLVRMKFSYYILHGSDDRAIFEFLSKNRHIEHLSFYTCSLSMAGMRSLAEYLPNLKSLDVDYMNIVGWDTQQKGTVFECLENVTIGRCSHTEWLVDLLDGAPLKRLDLFVEDKQTIKGISRLASLSSLTLRRFTSMTIDDVLQLTRSMKSLEELDLDMGAIGTITLPCIERLLKGLHQLTDLRVGWNKAADFNGAHELDAISTLIANRPDLRVRVDVPHQCTRIPDNVWYQHIKWLRGFRAEDTDLVDDYTEDFQSNLLLMML